MLRYIYQIKIKARAFAKAGAFGDPQTAEQCKERNFTPSNNESLTNIRIANIGLLIRNSDFRLILFLPTGRQALFDGVIL